MSYYLAKSLATLRDEVNAAAPNRDKASDGWVGDTSHSARKSDHNPDYARGGVVRALDIDHDPKGGCDAALIAKRVAKMLGKHPALGPGAYVIFNRRIISTDRLSEGWRTYTGVNAHLLHVHVSVGQRGYNSVAKWGVLGIAAAIVTKVSLRLSLSALRKQARAKTPKKSGHVRRLQKALNAETGARLHTDGVWGPATARAYRSWQRSLGLEAHGIPSPKSLTILAARHGRYRVVK